MASPPRTGLWPTFASSPLANDLKTFVGYKTQAREGHEKRFSEGKNGAFRAFVPEDSQSVERQRVLRTASAIRAAFGKSEASFVFALIGTGFDMLLFVFIVRHLFMRLSTIEVLLAR